GQFADGQRPQAVKELFVVHGHYREIRLMGHELHPGQILARVAVLLSLDVAGVGHYVGVGENPVAFNHRTGAIGLPVVEQTPWSGVIRVCRCGVDFYVSGLETLNFFALCQCKRSSYKSDSCNHETGKTLDHISSTHLLTSDDRV